MVLVRGGTAEGLERRGDMPPPAEFAGALSSETFWMVPKYAPPASDDFRGSAPSFNGEAAIPGGFRSTRSTFIAEPLLVDRSLSLEAGFGREAILPE